MHYANMSLALKGLWFLHTCTHHLSAVLGALSPSQAKKNLSKNFSPSEKKVRTTHTVTNPTPVTIVIIQYQSKPMDKDNKIRQSKLSLRRTTLACPITPIFNNPHCKIYALEPSQIVLEPINHILQK